MESTTKKSTQISKRYTVEERGSTTFFSVDYVVGAYQKGRKDGVSEYKQANIDLLKRNVSDVGKFVKEIFIFLTNQQIAFEKVYIKLADHYEIDVLIAVSQEDYLKKEFLGVYDLITNLENDYNNDSLDICVSFIVKDKNFDEEEVLSDGFIATI